MPTPPEQLGVCVARSLRCCVCCEVAHRATACINMPSARGFPRFELLWALGTLDRHAGTRLSWETLHLNVYPAGHLGTGRDHTSELPWDLVNTA